MPLLPRPVPALSELFTCIIITENHPPYHSRHPSPQKPGYLLAPSLIAFSLFPRPPYPVPYPHTCVQVCRILWRPAITYAPGPSVLPISFSHCLWGPLSVTRYVSPHRTCLLAVATESLVLTVHGEGDLWHWKVIAVDRLDPFFWPITDNRG